MNRYLIFGGAALIILGALYWQYKTIGNLQLELRVAQGNIEGLKEINTQISRNASLIPNKRSKLANDLKQGNQNEIMEYLALPVPDGLRGAAENYINSRD